MKKIVLFVLAVSLFFVSMHAQNIPNKLKQARWVKIMSNDSSYNYLEAEAEFQKYYNSYQKEKRKEESRRTVNPSHAEEEHKLSPQEYLISKYQEWSVTIKPFVRKDGSIIPLSARLKIIQDAKKKQQSQ
jgi:hypothetical protein